MKRMLILFPILVLFAGQAPAKPWDCTCEAYGCLDGYILKKSLNGDFNKKVEAPDQNAAKLDFRGEADARAKETCKQSEPAWNGTCTEIRCVDAYDPRVRRRQ